MTTARATVTTSALLMLLMPLVGCNNPAGPADGAATDRAPITTASSPAPTAGPDLAAPLTTVPAEAMVLPPASRPGTVAWQSIGLECDLGTPQGASAMRSDQEGDGAFETTATVQQVAAFTDVAAAVAEADRVAAAMRGCADRPEHSTESIPIGAQGVGLSYSYGPDANDPPYGNYLVLTRRGNALTLTGQLFGEGSVESARATATELARRGWAALCRYDRTTGC